METLFLDTSALIKRYMEEAGSEKVRALMNGAKRIIVSRLAYVEALSALVRRQKTLDLSEEEFLILIGEFKMDWSRFGVLELDAHTLAAVGRLIEKHRLRGADSIHLSTALYLKQATQLQVLFVASDVELLKAARSERFKTVNPSHFASADLLQV